MTSDNSLLPILRRLDQIERKIDRIVEELQMPTAIGYSVRAGISPRLCRCAGGFNEQIFGADEQVPHRSQSDKKAEKPSRSAP